MHPFRRRFWHFYLAHPGDILLIKPGIYWMGRSGLIRILPLAKPHGWNEHKDGAWFQIPNWLRTCFLVCTPDFTVGGTIKPYLQRWWILPKNDWIGVYLHHFRRSDDDRALHDHRYWNISILLKGSYIEEVPDFSAARTPFTRIADLPRKRIKRRAGSIIFRRADSPHRIELIDDQPVWTIFITGRVTRKWGFHCKKGWVYWRDFVGADPGLVGAGCGEE